MPKITRKTLLLAPFVMLSIVIVLYLGLMFVNYSLAGVVEAQYKRQITHTFDATFPQLDPYLQDLGVTMLPAERVDCPSGPYSPTMPCSQRRESMSYDVDTVDKQRWTKAGARLDKQLRATGWTTTAVPNSPTTFAKVFETGMHNDATYYKKIDSIWCVITSSFSQPNGTKTSIFISEGCNKYTQSPREKLGL